jgi:hypothetical protein
MQAKSGASMPETSKTEKGIQYGEEWVVVTDKEQHILNEKQIELLREADKAGHRGIVWFEEFAIPIPYIKDIYRIRRWVKNQLLEGKVEELEMTPAQREKIEKKIKIIRQKHDFLNKKKR